MQAFERQLTRITAVILAAVGIGVGQTTSAPQTTGGSTGRQALELFEAQRYPEAKDRATAGAAAGDAASMYVLGEIYSSGKGASKNYTESAAWMATAAKAGYAPAMNALGNLYEAGTGVPRDYAQAVEWYQRGAEAGSAAAMTSLGLIYENGRVATQAVQPGEPDFGEALKWYKKAAVAGDAHGMYLLGLCYDVGKGTAPDQAMAREWYGNAAAAGWSEAIAQKGQAAAVNQSSPKSAPTPAEPLTPKGPCAGATRPERISDGGITITEVATKLRARGEVDVRFTIEKNGTVRDPEMAAPFGYGLEERALQAIRQWRFRPSIKDGRPMACPSSAGFVLGQGNQDTWDSGRMVFNSEGGLKVPVVKDGSMPRAGAESPSNDSIILDFTVDATGAISQVSNSGGTSAYLAGYLKYWKFQPAVKDGRAVEAAGRILFVKGKGDEAVNRQLSAPPPRSAAAGGVTFIPSDPPSSPAAPQASPRRIRTMLNPQDNQVYIWIPPGSFTKGCSPGDAECGNNEKPSSVEQVESGFWMGQTEVTQAAYGAVIGNNPSSHKGDRLPVESVTWNDAVSYCASAGGRLPTDTEWEYAARAGTTEARYGSLDAIAWHAGNSSGMTHPVAEKQPNAFGLYDMLGNVWEWVQDTYPGTAQRILRGGSLFMAVPTTRASQKMPGDVQARFNGRGFRCAGQWPPQQDAVPSETVVAPPPAPAATGPNPVRLQVAPGTAGPDGVYRAGNGVSKPILIGQVEPEYSEEARKAKIEGVVILSVMINAKGNVENPKLMKGLGKGLDEKAIEAVRKWKFEPARKDGQPVPLVVTISVNFRLL